MRRYERLLSVALAVGLGMAISVPVTAGDSPAATVGVPSTVAAVRTVNMSEAAAGESPSRGHGLLPTTAAGIATTGSALSNSITQQAPPASAKFLALADSSSWSTPPNTSGAAGPGHLMTALTTQILFQAKNGATVLGPVGLNGFWNPVAGGSGADDPRVAYDPLGGRWMTIATDDTASTTTGGVLMAVSWTNDPTGNWQLFKISTAPYWADRPTVGFNKNWVVVQANLYDGTGFVGSRVYAIDRPGFFQNSPPTLSYRTINVAGLAVVPAATYGTATDPLDQPEELYLLQAWSPGAGALHLYKLLGPVGSETIPPPVAVAPSTPVPWSDGTGAADFAPQRSGCTAACEPNCRINTGDSRIQNVVYRNGYLWAAHTVFFPAMPAPSRSSIQWWKIDPFLAGVADRGLVDDPTGGRFFAFPSIAVNRNDDVLLGYSRFEGDEFAGASYSFRTAIDPDGTMQSERRLRDGDACYYKDPASLGTNHWGAYSATAVDPADDKTLWTVQEYAATPAGGFDHWGTYWGELDPTPAIVISDATIAENVSPGTSSLVFYVSLRSSDPAHSVPLPTSQTVTVDWSTQLGTATAGLDYVSGSGTVTFAPGETTKAITVVVNSDSITPEPNETLFVNLANPANATVADGQGQGTIFDLPLPQMSISDVQVVEGNPPTGYTDANFKVTLSHPSSTIVSFSWSTKDGTATVSGSDYLPGGVPVSPVSFNPGEVEKTLTVAIVPDNSGEGDETFTVELTAPSGAILLKPIGTCTILNDDVTTASPPVSSLVVLSDGDAASGRNRLQWVNPDPATGAQGIRINFTNPPTGCPTSPGSGDWGSPPTNASDVSFGGAGAAQTFTHDNLSPDVEYCYAVWVSYGPSTWSPGTAAKGTPFDATGKVQWKYFTGATSVAMPTVGQDVLVQPSNSGSLLHGMTRGRLGGMWPTPWSPYPLGSPAQARSPIVPLSGGPLAFVSTLDGRIRAIDTATRLLRWSTLLPEGRATAAPAGIFTPYGAYDYILVGTSSGAGDHFYALDPYSGAVIDSFPGPSDGAVSLGPVFGMASVDYATSRVYFTSHRAGGTGPSLWCLDLGPSFDALRLRWSSTLADVDASPVLRNGRVYVADNNPGNWAVWSIPADTGAGGYSLRVGNSVIKGYLFPDRYGSDLYGATDGEIIAVTDTGTALQQKWSPRSLSSPSIPLLEPGTTKLYVGVSSYSGNASLVRIDTNTGNVAGNVTLEPSAQTVGPPALDIGLSPDPNMIYVGSEKGVLYAVEASF